MKSLDEYKRYLPDYLKKYHNITNLKKFFHCLNPQHPDNHPSMRFTSKYNICKCFYEHIELFQYIPHFPPFLSKKQ